MGVELVRIASAEFAHLSGNQFKVLIRMCITALDKPNRDGEDPRRYFAGWELLSMALGRDVPPDRPEHERRRKKLSSEISTIGAALEKAGAVQRLIDHPQTKQQQEYYLSLEPTEPTTEQAPQNGEPPASLKQVGSQPHETADCLPVLGSTASPKQGATCLPVLGSDSLPETGTPRNHRGGIKDEDLARIRR